jgi:hypothetical protein
MHVEDPVRLEAQHHAAAGSAVAQSTERNLSCWIFFDFVNTEVFAISREKAPNLMSVGREPNAACSNQDFS